MKNKSYIGIKNESNDVLELHFTDFIYDGFDWETWEEKNLVQDTIDKIKAANPSKIKIVINSLGGEVLLGLALYNYLKNHKAEKEVEIIGFAASIASVIAMCADPDKLKMAKNSFMIIHAAWSYAVGNAAEIREQAAQLDKVTNELADIYAQRSGKKASHFTNLWADGDVWLTGTEAKELGLVDELFNAEPVKAHVDISTYNFKNIPAALLNDVKKQEDPKTFFSTLKSDFMSLIDDLKAAVGAGKKNEKFKDVPKRDEILDMVEEILKPFAEAVDQKEEKPKEEAEKENTDGTAVGDPQPAEPVPAVTPNVPPATPAPANDSAEIKKLQDQVKKLQDDAAGKATLPEKEDIKKTAFSKVKVEYMD